VFELESADKNGVLSLDGTDEAAADGGGSIRLLLLGGRTMPGDGPRRKSATALDAES